MPKADRILSTSARYPASPMPLPTREPGLPPKPATAQEPEKPSRRGVMLATASSPTSSGQARVSGSIATNL